MHKIYSKKTNFSKNLTISLSEIKNIFLATKFCTWSFNFSFLTSSRLASNLEAITLHYYSLIPITYDLHPYFPIPKYPYS